MSESSTIDNEIKSRLRDIFPDKATAKRIIDTVVNHKPPGWSRKSQAPYYKEFFGKWLQDIANKMMKERNDIVFRYEVYCGITGEKMSEQTLYNRVNQAKRYLIDCLDPDDLYKTWDALTNINREKGLGVTIRFKTEFHDFIEGIKESASPDAIIPQKDEPLWRRKMNEWLESDETRPFIKEGLAMTSDQVKVLSDELDSLEGIQASVNAISVKIIRVNE